MRPRPFAIAALTLALWLIPASPEAQEPSSTPAPAEPEAAPEPAVRAGSPDPVRPQPKRGKGIRTLDEITIEGELDVPQVLFITARDRQRYFDHLHRAYLRNSLEIGLETVFPERVIARIKP